MTREELIAFEADIAEKFNNAEIRAPVHLAGGNEDSLIDVFKYVAPEDWVFCTWRSHFHALLHGVAPERVKAEIMAGRSISLCFPDHRFFSSAIVGGNLPIALGVAWAIKRAKGRARVWAFAGDMAAAGGMMHEVSCYAGGHGLPINFVIEDNGKSVCTNTKATWKLAPHEREGGPKFTRYTYELPWPHSPKFTRYTYELPWPHSGAGKRVEF